MDGLRMSLEQLYKEKNSIIQEDQQLEKVVIVMYKDIFLEFHLNLI